jgi:hypothetical protein
MASTASNGLFCSDDRPTVLEKGKRLSFRSLHGIEQMLCWYPKIHVTLHAKHAAFPKIYFKMFIKMQPFKSNQNFIRNAT